MKKILSLILALCLMMTAASALAETMTTELMKLDNGVTIVLNHEENVKFYPAAVERPNIGYWMIEDGVHAAVTLNIAPSEIDSELSLGDLTEEQQLQYGAMVGEMFANPEIHLDTTPSGNKYLHICSNEESDIDTILTIYKGYFVEMIQFSDDNFQQLTEEDKAFCLSLLHGIEFVTAE